MNLNYYKACQYVNKCGYPEKDYVHDAFVYHWERTGRNLFDEPNRLVIQVVRQSMRRGWNKANRFFRQGEMRLATFCDVKDHHKTYTPSHGMLLSQVQANATKLTGTAKEVYTWLERGFTPQEIQEVTGISRQLVCWHRGKFRNKLSLAL